MSQIVQNLPAAYNNQIRSFLTQLNIQVLQIQQVLSAVFELTAFLDYAETLQSPTPAKNSKTRTNIKLIPFHRQKEGSTNSSIFVIFGSPGRFGNSSSLEFRPDGLDTDKYRMILLINTQLGGGIYVNPETSGVLHTPDISLLAFPVSENIGERYLLSFAEVKRWSKSVTLSVAREIIGFQSDMTIFAAKKGLPVAWKSNLNSKKKLFRYIFNESKINLFASKVYGIGQSASVLLDHKKVEYSFIDY